MSQPQYFRIGAGAVIYRDSGELVLFARADNPSIWQLQQGGMDTEETITETLWRELNEETGLTPDDFCAMEEYPQWLSYTYPEEIRKKLRDPNCRGQIHRWFFLKLKPEASIDLEKANDKEFSEYTWTTPTAFLEKSDLLKKDVYTALMRYFMENVADN